MFQGFSAFGASRLALAGLAMACVMTGYRPATAQEMGARVDISRKDCLRAVAHRPAFDVAYKPDVDVYGRPVVPADLPGTQIIKTPTMISIDLSIDSLKAFGVSDGSNLASEASVGTVTYDINSGRLEYNGQPLTDPELAAIAAACAKAEK